MKTSELNNIKIPNMDLSGPHQNTHIVHYGSILDDAKSVMIMIHGRGLSAHDILSLAYEIDLPDTTYIAPQAKNNTWYPYSFLSPIEQNEPDLSSGLVLIDLIVDMLLQKGFASEQIYLLGFSQGACLSLEYVARNPKKFGGVFGLSGGLIGPALNPLSYNGNLGGIEVFLGCSDVDPHIPLERVNQTEEIFEKLGASVTKRIYNGMAHTVNQDEIEFIKSLINVKK
jgi:phospholipase/carboxylesterase